MSNDPGLRRLALGTLLAAFRGATAPAWAGDLLAEGLAGHVLFGYNIVEREQLAALTAQLHAVRPGVLLGIDEEGGDVTRLAHRIGSPYPGNAALGAVGDPAVTRRIYRTIGAELDGLGLNLNLAPTVDVNTADDNPIIGTRSFGAEPHLVAAHAAAAVSGLQSARVAACAKHFPGHGATLADSHLELPTVDIDLDLLRRRELPPFAAAIEAGTKSIMTAHIRVPVLTGDAPATFSRAVLVDLLRAELGFTGVVITDALEMLGAARYAGGITRGAVLALAAGADLLCIGAQVDEALTLACADEIVAAVGDGRLPLARLEEAARRTVELADWTRGADRTDREEPGLGYPAALGAVRIEGSLDGLRTPLVVQLESESSIAAGPVPWGLGPHINGTEQLRLAAAQADPAALLERAGDRPIVVVGRNLHRLSGARDLIEGLAETHPVIVVEMGWPSSWRPPSARAFVTTWGASHANGRAAAKTLGLAA
jgi:beta-N-acetylhexosaminidase